MAEHPLSERLEQLNKRKEEALNAGSEAARQRQHDRGKMLARERVEYFLDPGSFHELDLLARTRLPEAIDRPYTDGVITGWGTVDGRKVFVFSQDFTIFGGALGEVFAEKVHKLMDMALKVGAPLIGLNDGAGARIQEGVVSLDSYGGIFYRNVQSSGVIPQISVIMGPCAGGAVYSPAMTDFVFMVDGTSYMFITGPDVVKTVTGEEVTQQELGGAVTHASKSGVCQFISADDKSCLDDVRYLLSFLPPNNLEEPPAFAASDDPERRCPELVDLIPSSPNQPYDMHKVIEAVVDDGEYFEYAARWAPNILCAYARLDGRPVGIVGNQPMHLAGVLDIESSEKAARFVRTCDAFNVPLLTFVDVPGFLPGVDQEHGGIIRHGAKLLYAYCESTVPRIQVVVRKAYGGAYVVMNSKSIGADLAFAWPSAELAVMGPQGAVEIVYRRELQMAADPTARKAELVDEYTERFANPYGAAERGFVDDVIDPADTRATIIAGFELLRSNSPL
jgi:acetyl-CoA carboxylase carboxyltransferase component